MRCFGKEYCPELMLLWFCEERNWSLPEGSVPGIIATGWSAFPKHNVNLFSEVLVSRRLELLGKVFRPKLLLFSF